MTVHVMIFIIEEKRNILFQQHFAKTTIVDASGIVSIGNQMLYSALFFYYKSKDWYPYCWLSYILLL